MIFIDSYQNYLKIIDDTIYVYRVDEKYNKSIIYDYYYQVLKEYVKSNFDDFKKDMNIDFNVSVIYKDVNTYFGKCFPKRRQIILNLQLAKYDYFYIKSVIYHELTHFYYLGHQDDFYNLIEQKIPGYRIINHNLRQISYNDMY